MGDIHSFVKNAIANGHNGYISHSTNNPYSADSLPQYYSNLTRTFYEQNLEYTSNFVTAQVQGVDYNDFYSYTPLKIRTAMVIDPTTGNNLGSDWQRIIVQNGNVDFLPRGAKVVFGGSTWLVVNPMNVESVMGTSVIRRCNATWHYLDEYGNVRSEPFCYGNGAGDMATTNDVKETMILVNGYQHSIMQLNPNTAVLTHNYRMILGNQAFAIHTIQNFAQEFTEDEDSTHIQFFDLYRTEPLEIDDIPNRVAGGKAFSWVVSIDNVESVAPGESVQLSATSIRNSQIVEDVEYIWSSSDESVATVNDDGVMEAISDGVCTITCAVLQNPSLSDTMELVVSSVKTNELKWLYDVPTAISQYTEANVTAVCGEQTVAYSYSGAETYCYNVKTDNGNNIIECWQPSETPLTVTAKCGEQTIVATIALEGW